MKSTVSASWPGRNAHACTARPATEAAITAANNQPTAAGVVGPGRSRCARKSQPTRKASTSASATRNLSRPASCASSWPTGASDATLDELAGLTGLKSLVLEGTDVSDEGASQLRETMSGTQIITQAVAAESTLPDDKPKKRTASRRRNRARGEDRDAAQGPEHLAIGQEAPDIEGQDVDGVAFKLSDYRGKVVVLDFWGHW